MPVRIGWFLNYLFCPIHSSRALIGKLCPWHHQSTLLVAELLIYFCPNSCKYPLSNEGTQRFGTRHTIPDWTEWSSFITVKEKFTSQRRVAEDVSGTYIICSNRRRRLESRWPEWRLWFSVEFHCIIKPTLSSYSIQQTLPTTHIDLAKSMYSVRQ